MKRLPTLIAGILIGASLIPVVGFAARTAAPVLTGLFPSASLSVNLPRPTLALAAAPVVGSVATGTIAFAVTALDGVGETVPSSALATTSVGATNGYLLTWAATPGATSYRVYFSTSTTQSFTQYFTATTTGKYTFTSTSSPVFIPAGIPSTNSAYADTFVANGNSWLNGGSFAIGTTTFPTGILLQVSTTTATSTPLIGAKGASGGRFILVDSTATKTTCTEIYTVAGTVTGKAITCP